MLTSNGLQLCNKKKRRRNDFQECCSKQIGPDILDSEYQQIVQKLLPLEGDKKIFDRLYGSNLTQRLQNFIMHTTHFLQQNDFKIARLLHFDHHYTTWISYGCFKHDTIQATDPCRYIKYMMKVLAALMLSRIFFSPLEMPKSCNILNFWLFFSMFIFVQNSKTCLTKEIPKVQRWLIISSIVAASAAACIIPLHNFINMYIILYNEQITNLLALS